MSDGWIGVTGLMRLAIAGDLLPHERAVLERGDSGEIVSIASAHGVLPLLAHAAEHPACQDLLEPDLAEFFNVMRANNITRNRMLRDHLVDIGNALARAGIEGVVLKGGNELLTPMYPQGGRFIGDLDILVGPEHIDTAWEIFHQLGYVSRGDRDDPALHHHLPALQHTTTYVSVELHRRLATGRGDKVVPANLVLETSQPSSLAGLRVPADWVRLLHVVVHAQNGAPAGVPHDIRLRDLSEIQLIAHQLEDDDRLRARDQATAGGMQLEFDGMLEISLDLLATPCAKSPEVAAWVGRAVSTLGVPEIRRRNYIRERLSYYLGKIFSDAEARRRYIGHLLRPAYVLKAMRQHRAEFHNIR